jgi:hypothetical protein
MKRIFLLSLFILDVSFGQAPQQSAPPPRTPAPTPASGQSLRGRLNYKPVGPGVPSGRVDAGSRGEGDEIASLYVIAPENIGLSTRSQPTLFWFQTAPAKLPYEITLLRPNDPKPVLRLHGSDGTAGGFHRLNLADHGIHLAPGVDYQWVVALIRDPQSRSRDIVSSGWVRHSASSGAAVRPGDAASLAAAGLWYDTVAALFAQIDKNPRDAQLAADRRDLLTQVGLPPLPNVPSAKPR